MSWKLIALEIIVQDFLAISLYFLSIVLREQPQLLWSKALDMSILPFGISPVMGEGAFDKWQCNVVAASLMYKCCISSRIDPCDWSRREFFLDRRCLVDQRKSIAFPNHPLDIRRSSCGTGQIDPNSHLFEHLR